MFLRKQVRLKPPHRANVASLLAVAWLCACASKSTNPVTPSNEAPPVSGSSGAANDGGSSPDTPVSSPAQPESDAGQDDEMPKDCNFRVKAFCFKTDEEACAAAGCDQAHCLIMESHPARVRCRN
jgi:hypothetical protein